MKPFRLTSLPTPAPASANTLRGQNAQRAGSNLQKAILWSAGVHKSVVTLAELPSFGAKRVAGGKLVPTKIICDYVGCFAGGVALHFDAKSSGEDKVAFDVKLHVMSKPHQFEHLHRISRAEGVAGYLVEARAIAKYLWLPVEEISDDGPIRFCRDGKLCRHWTDLGSTAGAVDFTKLKEVYK